MAVEGVGEDGGGCALADGAIGAQDGDSGAVNIGNFAAELAKMFFVLGAAHIINGHVVGLACGDKNRVVVKKLMKTIDDIHAMTHGFKHEAALVF